MVCFNQVWFADDSVGVGVLVDVKVWWEVLNRIGPLYGYHPKAEKTILILKDESLLQKAEELFGPDNVKITVEGSRHIGAVIGTGNFKERFVNSKIEKWAEDVNILATFAEEEPQAALSAFNTGVSQRWKFVQRTVPGISHLFQPLEDAIRHSLIPAICGREVSDLERRLLAIPYRYGGLGIQNPVNMANREYDASIKITDSLTTLICEQEMDLSKLNKESAIKAKQELRVAKENFLQNEFNQISAQLNEKEKRLLLAACEKGASSWLSALPLKRLGYSLNKQEFRDALCLPYGWTIPNTPTHCGCGDRNSLDHILTCKRGGFVAMWHNVLRNTPLRGRFHETGVC